MIIRISQAFSMVDILSSLTGKNFPIKPWLTAVIFEQYRRFDEPQTSALLFGFYVPVKTVVCKYRIENRHNRGSS